MRTLFAAALLVLGALAACSSPPVVPMSDGAEFTYKSTVGGEPSKTVYMTISFAKEAEGWRATLSDRKTNGDESELAVELDAALWHGGGESGERRPIRVSRLFPFFLPQGERKAGGSISDYRVQKQKDWKTWKAVWPATLAHFSGYYDDKTGFFLGMESSALPVESRLVKSNIEGLAAAE